MGQREVHVVAADQQVIAHGHPPQHQLTLFLGHVDQRQVGCAAADVADQQRIAQLQGSPPAVAAIGQPGVDGRLRLFQQHRSRQARASAASRVSSRAAASNEAGTVSTTFCSAAGASGCGLLPGRHQVLQISLRRPAGRRR